MLNYSLGEKGINLTGFNKKELIEILDGYYVCDINEELMIHNFEIDPNRFDDIDNTGNCFISISNTRWNLANNKETGWVDGNEKALHFYPKCQLIITEEPIESLHDQVMQLIVKDSFAAIQLLAKAARKKMKNPVIGITGSVGKSSTRLMIEHLLTGKRIVATRGNHNTQVGVPLYGAKLCSNPNVGIIEISLNALNNRGNQSLVIEPDICIVTSIGEAHLSTLHSKENIAKFKARIFEGLKPGGLAILNQDIKEFDILFQKAKEKTNIIKTYSLTNPQADLYLKNVTHAKYLTKIEFHYKEKDYRFEMKIPSNGMIENALCAFLCLAEMGYEIAPLLIKISDFKSFDRVMELKQIKTLDNRLVDVLDDTHNAAIPSMLNAIDTFKAKAPFYAGTKILVLGQVADLGEQSQKLHDELLPKILSAGADYVFGHGHYMRNVIKQLPAEKVVGWFDNAKDLAKRIPMYCSDQSIVLVKGSVSGSDFRRTSYLLPGQIKVSDKKPNNYEPSSIAEVIQPTWGAICYDMEKKEKINIKGDPRSSSIEGLGPIILLLLIHKIGIEKNNLVALKKWPTNRGYSLENKPFKTGENFSLIELMKELIKTQHPSATYELAHSFYSGSKTALEEIAKIAKSIGISSSATYNLTGRYRVKEQQAYNLEDLYKIGTIYFEQKDLLKQLPILKIGANQTEVHVVEFGNVRKAAICFYKNLLICIIGCANRNQMEEILSTFQMERLAKRVKKEELIH